MHDDDTAGLPTGGPAVVCQWERCSRSLQGKRRDARYCSQRCQCRARRRRLGMRENDPPLSPYWREYLRRFDRALVERTPEAWAAFREGRPDPGRNRPRNGLLARLMWSLEEG